MIGRTAVSAPDNLRATIARSLNSLSPSGERVARFLLAEGAKRDDFSLREIARQSGVSEAAVVRMCKALGFRGFREFRLAWARERGLRADRERTPELFADVVAALRETEALIQEGLADAAAAIARADRVFLYGSGASALVAEVTAKSFMVAGHFAVAYRDDSGGQEALRHVGGSSVVLVISHRGENEALADVLRHGKERGAVCIVLTSEPKSSLAGMADILLATGGALNTPKSSAVGSHGRVVQLAAVHALITEISSQAGG